jgi:ubiquinone/menaquinone biosynthesis C-methylase UbiE
MNKNTIFEQRDFWNKASASWKKWDRIRMEWHGPVGKKIIELANIKPTDIVLDIATGAGEPGLSAAPFAKEVKGIDISSDMVDAANEFAKLRDVKNYSARLYDGKHFPFSDESFDAAISRNGIIFFPDLNETMKEVLRVLKPGGRFVFSGWGPPENNDSSVIIRKIVTDILQQELTPLDAPGPFRFSKKGFIHTMLSDAGFRDVNEIDLRRTVKFDSAEHYWQYISQTQMLVIEALEKAGIELANKIKSAVFEYVKPYTNNGQLEFKWHAVIGYGIKS